MEIHLDRGSHRRLAGAGSAVVLLAACGTATSPTAGPSMTTTATTSSAPTSTASGPVPTTGEPRVAVVEGRQLTTPNGQKVALPADWIVQRLRSAGTWTLVEFSVVDQSRAAAVGPDGRLVDLTGTLRPPLAVSPDGATVVGRVPGPPNTGDAGPVDTGLVALSIGPFQQTARLTSAPRVKLMYAWWVGMMGYGESSCSGVGVA